MIDLYENEVDVIYSAVQKVQKKYWGKDVNGDNLMRLQNELVDRLNDLGFGATVDVTPVLEGHPIDVRIDERLDQKPFDQERKRWEVKRRIERNDDDPDKKIEGMV